MLVYGQRRAATLGRHRAVAPLPPALPASVLIATEGDSITNGLGATGGEPGWPGKAVPALLTSGPAYTLANVATSGITVTAGNGIDPGYATRNVGASYDPGKALNVVTVMGGTNDGAIGGRVAVYRGLRSFIRKARASGYQRVAIGTLISRSDGGAASPDNNQYFSANALPLNLDIRALWNSDLDADGLIDFAADARFDAAADADSSVYYTDKLHPANAGYTAMAAVAAPVLNAIVAAPGARVPPPATWSPFDLNQFLALSNGNRTVTFPSGFADASTRAFPGAVANKVYWEVAVEAASYVQLGVMSRGFEGVVVNNSVSLQGSPYALGLAIGYGNGFMQLNGVEVRLGDDFGSGNVWRFCVDPVARRLWAGTVGSPNWNGVSTGTSNPAAGIGGIDLSSFGAGPIYPAGYIRAAGGQFTARFAAGQMTGTIPPGFAPLAA